MKQSTFTRAAQMQYKPLRFTHQTFNNTAHYDPSIRRCDVDKRYADHDSTTDVVDFMRQNDARR